MDIQNVAAQLVQYLGKNPDRIEQFIEHPYSTTAKATGSDAEISKKDMSQIITAAAALANGQQLGINDIANVATALLGQNNNSVHDMTSMLFGGGASANTSQAVANAQAQTSQSGTLNLGSLVSMAAIAAILISSAKAKQQQAAQQQAAAQQQSAVQLQTQTQPQVQQQQAAKPTVDLGNIAALASQFLSSNGASTTSTAQPVTLAQPASTAPTAAQNQGIDFGTIAQLASVLLKK